MDWAKHQSIRATESLRGELAQRAFAGRIGTIKVTRIRNRAITSNVQDAPNSKVKTLLRIRCSTRRSVSLTTGRRTKGKNSRTIITMLLRQRAQTSGIIVKTRIGKPTSRRSLTITDETTRRLQTIRRLVRRRTLNKIESLTTKRRRITIVSVTRTRREQEEVRSTIFVKSYQQVLRVTLD